MYSVCEWSESKLCPVKMSIDFVMWLNNNRFIGETEMCHSTLTNMLARDCKREREREKWHVSKLSWVVKWHKMAAAKFTKRSSNVGQQHILGNKCSQCTRANKLQEPLIVRIQIIGNTVCPQNGIKTNLSFSHFNRVQHSDEMERDGQSRCV